MSCIERETSNIGCMSRTRWCKAVSQKELHFYLCPIKWANSAQFTQRKSPGNLHMKRRIGGAVLLRVRFATSATRFVLTLIEHGVDYLERYV